MNERRDAKVGDNADLMTKYVLLLALCGLAVTARGAEAVPPMLAAPRLAVAPMIDGAVGEEEWAAAAVVDGFEALSVQTAPLYRTRAWVGYDSENLYVAARCWMPHGTRPRADARRRDDTVFTDDAVEILLDPGRRGSEFQFIGNSIGTMFDAQGAASAWNAAWSYAARPTDIGWEGEWAIPFASVGRPTPQEGEMWGLLIGRDAWTPTNEFSQWGGCRVSWHAPTEFGSLVFHAAQPRIILREVAARGLEVNVTAEAVAPSIAPAAVTVRIRIMEVPKQTFGAVQASKVAEGTRSGGAGEQGRPALTPYTSGTAKLQIAAGERRPLTLPAFPKEPGSYALEINAVDGQGKPLLVQRIPLDVLAPLAVEVRCFPTAGVLEIGVDATPSGRASDVGMVECRLVSDHGRGLWTKIQPARSGRGEFRWTGYGELKPGAYRLIVRALDGLGREVTRFTRGLRKTPPPKWLHNRLGREDTVIPPWTPVEVVKGHEVRVWGRRYVFGPTGLPEHLESAGADLLAAPMRLVAEADGVTLQFDAAGPLAVTSSKTRAVVRSRSRVVGHPRWELKVNTTVEFDGFAWVELSLSDRKGGRLDRLWLEMPLAREHARYFLPVFNGSTSIPAEGLAAPVVSRCDWERQVTVGLEWVGDDDRGFAWSAEDDRHWASADRERALELVPGAEEVLWRAHFVDQTVSLNQPLTLSYCFLPTPAKPNDRWYAHRVVGDGGYDMVKRDQPRAVTLRYPADRVLRPERGALEIDAVILFDPSAPREQIVDSANNRDFFSVDVADHGEVISFWPADARTLAVVEMVKGQDRARLYGGWRPKLGQRFRLSYV
ncbi:MAG: hypothetical protein HY318_10645, partial [Armatimonadetes bacterium]|nr:hypothetical protein [Armatimonadota bacterium]